MMCPCPDPRQHQEALIAALLHRGGCFALGVVVAVLLSCTTKEPTVTVGPLTAIDDRGSLYVTANDQLPAIRRSLSAAGFEVLPSPQQARYHLRVWVGAGQRSKSCGSLRNVHYVLFDDGMRVVEIKGKGWAGTCTPSIFDGMSRTLAAEFAPLRERAA